MVTPAAKRKAVARLKEGFGMSERRACKAIGCCRMTVRYETSRPNDRELRERMKAIAQERRRFGYRRLLVMLRREGLVVNHKKLFRLYREEKLAVRRRGGRKRAIGTRAPMVVPLRPDERWSLDFVSDQLTDGRRFRILAVVDDCTRECLALIVDTSLSGMRVVRELDLLITERGRPRMIVSDNGLRAEGNGADSQSLSVRQACSRRVTLVKLGDRTKRLPLVREKVSSIANTGYAQWRPSPSSTRASDPGGRPEHYLQGHRSDALTALADRGPSTWHPPFDEGPVV